MWRTSLYLAASASAEFFADIALCPMEAVKVRIQTQPGWANNLREGMPKLYSEEGVWGYVIYYSCYRVHVVGKHTMMLSNGRLYVTVLKILRKMCDCNMFD